jgi:hypothetical protein
MKPLLDINNDYDTLPRAKKLAEISKVFYAKFDDDFDSLFFICFSNLGKKNGEGMIVNNDVDGIGLPLGYRYGDIDWGSSKLKNALRLGDGYQGVLDGILLHEFAHNWGNFIFLDDIDSMNTHTIGAHWGLSNAGGVLGGFKEVRQIGPNSYNASLFSNKIGFGLAGNFDIPYSDIELYLMGFKSAEELRSTNFQLDIYTGGSVDNTYSINTSLDGNFTATGKVSYSIDDIISKYGPVLLTLLFRKNISKRPL